MMDGANSTMTIDALIEKARRSGGSERANYQLFIIGLCEALGLPRLDFSADSTAFDDYVFERRVAFNHADGTKTAGFIDCYRRGCFILEAKQSKKRRLADDDQLPLPVEAIQRTGHAVQGTRSWDRVMVEARKQAENYARALPVEHGYPPFLLIVDVGHVIEVFADFSGQGKNYAHFPDRQSYRITMEDLRDAEVQERLRAIWRDPQSLDPTRRSAEATRDIAIRLARVARRLEKKHDAGTVAEFLMRCVFTMFAEDAELLPKDSFKDLLAKMRETPQNLVPALESLWSVMDEGGYAPHLNAVIKRFNGVLFKTRTALPLEADEIGELHTAAKRDWKEVEPSIFGTLLEQALDARERSKLGAHYTPRAYVERLVIPTIIEPLRADWSAVQAAVRDLQHEDKAVEALNTVRAFHRKLCSTRVLDPACGTGNFLYVSLELMKRLEGEVLEAIRDLGGEPDRYRDFPEDVGASRVGRMLTRSSGRFTVDPHQFYGLELNPRAVPIADLVLWIGFLKWQLRTGGEITEPVLDAYGTIQAQDAVIAYDAPEPMLGDDGKPRTRWDGFTMKPHPITGEDVPDPDARAPLMRYPNPRRATWPDVEFIVGNPPFIGGKDMRAELGDGYAEACWAARSGVPGGADFVMHFWDEAARRLAAKGTKGKPNPTRRFGFITTNSITQTFSRRVIEQRPKGEPPISIIFAVPNHPWQKAADKAQVRIAMTVAEAGERPGVLSEVIAESGLNTDTPTVLLSRREGVIRANLTIGAHLSAVKPLWANEGIASPGVKLHGAGFIVSPQQATVLGLGRVPGLERHILPYRNGRDIAQRPRGVMVIDLFPLNADEVRDRFPAVFQHIVETVKPERDQNNEEFRRTHWWLFGRRHTELRAFLAGLPRYIATVETTRHRVFQFLDGQIRPDNMLIAIGTDRTDILSVLSSRLHSSWAIASGGWMGVGNDPRYSKTRTFDPFPFPAFATLASDLRARLAHLGEKLNAFRKARLAEHPHLTITALYNALERRRELENGCPVAPLSDAERDVSQAGSIAVLADLHDQIDRATLAAYGWDDLAPALVGKPGATLPSPHKTREQEQAEEELLMRLVALNRARAAEEKRGVIHWLRPEFQIPLLRHKAPTPDLGLIEVAPTIAPIAAAKADWPKDGLDQIIIVREALSRASAPVGLSEIATQFGARRSAKRDERIAEVLARMAESGLIQTAHESGGPRYFVPG